MVIEHYSQKAQRANLFEYVMRMSNRFEYYSESQTIFGSLESLCILKYFENVSKIIENILYLKKYYFLL